MKLRMEALSKSYDKKTVLKDLDFTFESGKIYGLLGRNGAGKTTLFHCVSRDLRFETGRFFLEQEGQERELASEDVGCVSSTPTVPEFLTGWEFVRFFLDIHEKSIPHPRPIEEYLDFVGIGREDQHRLMKDYSHGMKNKMQMLIQLIARPNVLLLDEPLTSLDVVAAEEMKQTLRSAKGDCITILSTHILELALDLCDEIVLLSHGKLERVDKCELDQQEFKEKIIEALKEESHD